MTELGRKELTEEDIIEKVRFIDAAYEGRDAIGDTTPLQKHYLDLVQDAHDVGKAYLRLSANRLSYFSLNNLMFWIVIAFALGGIIL